MLDGHLAAEEYSPEVGAYQITTALFKKNENLNALEYFYRSGCFREEVLSQTDHFLII